MNVLIACECSQTVCGAFRNRGHNAFSCDIEKEYGGHPEWHVQTNCPKARSKTFDGIAEAMAEQWGTMAK